MTEKMIYGDRSVEINPAPKRRVELIEGMPMVYYQSRTDAVSKSMLGEMDCPAKFDFKYNGLDEDGNPKEPEPSGAANMGSAVHMKALEPHLFDETFHVLPEGHVRNARHQAHKDEIVKAAGRTMLTAKEAANVAGMAKALVHDKFARAFLEAEGVIEGSIFWERQDGQLCKTRPDFLREDGLIVQIKTTHSADPVSFGKSCVDWHYDIGCAMECEAVELLKGRPVENYVFIVVEPEPPHVIQIYDTRRPMYYPDVDGEYAPQNLSFLDVGKTRFEKALAKYQQCKKSGIWAPYQTGIQPVKIPMWALKRMEGN